MATHAELVERLTAAIDNANTSPPTDGNATAPDEGQAAVLLARLGNGPPSSGPAPVAAPSHAGRVEQWQRNIEHSFLAYDRSVRALMVMIQARAARDEDDEIIDPTIAAWDPDTETDELAPELNAVSQMRCYLKYLPDIDQAVRDSALACARDYESFSRRPEPQRARTSYTFSTRSDEYAAAKRAAEAYVEYLDAVAPPGGVQ